MSKRDEMEVEEEADRNDIFTDKTAYTRYTSAAAVANKALAEAVKSLLPGKTVYEVTSATDKYITDLLNTNYGKTKLERGIAFPTCVSINNCIGHFSPMNTDKTTVKEGDLVKVDLGVHVDGFIAVAAHTFEVTSLGASAPAITGKKADVICAAHYAAEAAHRLIKAGGKNTEVTEAIAKIAEAFHVKPVEAVLSHQLKRFVIDGNNVIANKSVLDQKVEEVTFEEGQIYGVDIVMTTGEGKGREVDNKPTVFKRAVDQTYSLKLAASRTLLNEINKKSPTLPFTLASMTDQKTTKMGITELSSHGLVVPYPVLYERNGEYVAQIKFVAAILKKNTNRLTGHPLPVVTSEYKITDQSILDLLAQTTGKEKKKEAASSDAAPMETN